MTHTIGFFPSDFNPLATKQAAKSLSGGDDGSTSRPSPSIFIDIIDLMYELIELRKPDTFVDSVIDQLVGSTIKLERISVSKTRFRSWINSQTPHYTGSEKALNVLAKRLGYRVDVSKIPGKDVFLATAYDVTKRKRMQAVGYIAGSAGILAVLRLALKEQGK